MRLLPVPLLLCAALASACSAPRLPSLPSARDLPFIHKIDIQQGNVVTQDMLAQLERGMDPKKVQFIMGTPVVHDTFHADRWDYLYTYKPGGGTTERRRITLIFADDKLDRIEGDVKPAAGEIAFDLHQDTTVAVPGFRRKGFVARVKDKIPFVAESETVESDSAPDREADSEDMANALAEAALPPPHRVHPYDNIQAAPGEGVVVPPDAPTYRKKKGLIASFFDGIGIGAGDEDDERESFDPGDPRYRDITDQSDL
jgi:outer membrane protein assembly factor BamE